MDIPKEFLGKEFISQFKNADDIASFLLDLHYPCELDANLGYEKYASSGNKSGNSRNGKYPKKIQTEHGKSVIDIPHDCECSFGPMIMPKH